MDATDELGCRPCQSVECELQGTQTVPGLVSWLGPASPWLGPASPKCLASVVFLQVAKAQKCSAFCGVDGVEA